jgi:hypothetical protein
MLTNGLRVGRSFILNRFDRVRCAGEAHDLVYVRAAPARTAYRTPLQPHDKQVLSGMAERKRRGLR